MSNQLSERFREIILHGTWVANTNYKQQLSGLSWETATTSGNGLNTIAILAQHIHYYINGIKAFFTTGILDIKDQYSFDFPAVHSQDQWDAFLHQFWSDTEELAQLIANLPEQKWKQVFADEKYGTYQRNIDGMIEHSYYHLGQIVLIRKLLNQPKEVTNH